VTPAEVERRRFRSDRNSMADPEPPVDGRSDPRDRPLGRSPFATRFRGVMAAA